MNQCSFRHSSRNWTPEMFARAVVKRGLVPTPSKTLRRCALTLTWLGGFGARVAATNLE